ncbi:MULTISPECIES: DNA-binding protein [Halomonadaceae]|uniref:DNA-binding protein n=2 Tax=Vreelandella TaxID=3137766 RepID=A0A7Z0LQA9_9GAMM|nr:MULTISPECIES: DNA-binding protein [Halomonas]AJY50707.1 KfrA domain-containing protein DNA-binding domain-containing protein [Halomonas sp. KO116]NYS76645.1 DNA-binding protein [Halomonas glaciei]
MARNGIQYSDVQQAIDALLARGDTPSVQRIRDVLGTGSFTTISDHFRQWRSEREQNRDVPPPKGVPEVVVTMASELWREAQEVANQALLHYREDANRQVADAQQLAEDAKQQAANAEQRESALAEHLRHMEQRMEALNRELAASQTSEHHWHQLAEASHSEVNQLKQAQQQLKSQLEAQRDTHSQALSEQQVAWEQRLAQEEQRHEAAEGRLMAMLDSAQQARAQEEKSYQKRHLQSEQRVETLSQELKTKQQALHQLQLEGNEREQRLSGQMQQITSLEKQLKALTLQLNESKVALKKQAQQHADRETELQQAWQEKLWNRMEALQTQLTALPDALSHQSAKGNEPEQ